MWMVFLIAIWWVGGSCLQTGLKIIFFPNNIFINWVCGLQHFFFHNKNTILISLSAMAFVVTWLLVSLLPAWIMILVLPLHLVFPAASHLDSFVVAILRKCMSLGCQTDIEVVRRQDNWIPSQLLLRNS